ncbi:Ceramide synthase 6, partial [Perkinsus olseni]
LAMSSPGIDADSTAVSSNEGQQEGSSTPSAASCELRIQKLEEELRNLHSRLVSQELVIQELCGIGFQWKRAEPSDEAQEEVDSVPSPRVARSAVVAIAEELAAKRKVRLLDLVNAHRRCIAIFMVDNWAYLMEMCNPSFHAFLS